MKLTSYILCLAAGAAAPAAPVPPEAPQVIELDQVRIPHVKFVLPNGLTLVVHEDHAVPIVAVNLWYHVGSRNERRGRTGFAHLFEHFFFNGSENHPGGFREAMDDLGATNRNGTTNTDRTNFFEDVPVSALERTLYLEADRMGFLSGHLSQEMLERERGVVQNEKRQGENQPYGRVLPRIAESIYPWSHPYSWATIGLMEDLQAATLDDVREWYRTYYGPNNCVLALAGDITPQRALELVTKYFGPIPPGPALPRHAAWVPRLDRDQRDTMQDRVPQARIYRVYHAPAWGDPAALDLQLAAEALSGSKSARLDRRLVYEKELATSVSVTTADREIAGTFGITVTVKPGTDPAAAEQEMDAVLARYLKEGPTEEELRRGKTRVLASFVRGIERLGGFGGRSDVLAESATYGADPGAWMDRLRAMTTAPPDRVRDTSREWLDAHHYTMVVTPYPDLKADAAAIDRKIVPGLGEPPEVKFPQVQRRDLGNGLRLMLLERHGAPIVNAALAVDAGFSADPEGAAGTASLALAMMQEGTTTRDAFRIVDELDALGGVLRTDSSLDLSFVRLRALRMHLPASLEILSDVALHPAFPEEMVRLGVRRQLARIAQEKAQPIAMSLRLAPRLLFGPEHPYAHPFTGSGYEESVAKLTRADLAAWHAKWFRPGNATLIVTGDISMTDLAPAVEKAFGGWAKGTAPARPVPRAPEGVGGKVYLVDKPDAPQSVIVATHVSEPGGRPEDLAIEQVMRVFGGMATSRLNRNLRLDKHWSYGVSGMLIDARGPRPFTVIAPVQTDRTKESMVEVAAEIRGIAGDRPVAGEEFASLMRSTVSRLAGRFETLASLEGEAEHIVNCGVPPEYYYDYARNVRRLSEQDLAAAARKFVHPSRILWIVVGDLDRIEAGIRELGFGEVVRLDAGS